MKIGLNYSTDFSRIKVADAMFHGLGQFKHLVRIIMFRQALQNDVCFVGLSDLARGRPSQRVPGWEQSDNFHVARLASLPLFVPIYVFQSTWKR